MDKSFISLGAADNKNPLSQLNKTLDKANASIQNFAQVRLLEFKQAEMGYEPPLEQEQEEKAMVLSTIIDVREKISV